MLPFIVYGTLRPGHGNYQWALAGVTISEEDITVPNTRLVSEGGFPYLIPADGQQSIATLVTVHPDHYAQVLADLDHLEGYSPGSNFNLYDRTVRTVQTSTGTVDAWLYIPALYQERGIDRLHPVPENNWNLWDDEAFRARKRATV